MEYTTPLETETRFGGPASLLKNPMHKTMDLDGLLFVEVSEYQGPHNSKQLVFYWGKDPFRTTWEISPYFAGQPLLLPVSQGRMWCENRLWQVYDCIWFTCGWRFTRMFGPKIIYYDNIVVLRTVASQIFTFNVVGIFIAMTRMIPQTASNLKIPTAILKIAWCLRLKGPPFHG